MGFFIPLLIGLALNILAYLITPKPKQAKPEAAKDMDNPTAEAGKPKPVVFGTMTLKGTNILWYGEKSRKDYKVKEKSGKK